MKPTPRWLACMVAFLTAHASADIVEDLDALRTLAATHQHDRVIRTAEAILDDKANQDGWSLRFDRQRPPMALLGKRNGYVMMLLGRSEQPLTKVAAEHIPAEADQYDWHWYVTAVDLETGTARWTRSFLPHPRFAIDPRDDSLWVWHGKHNWFERFDPLTSKSIKRGVLHSPSGSGGAKCLIDGDTYLFSRWNRGDYQDSAIDLSTGAILDPVFRPYAYSKDLTRILTHASQYGKSTFICRAEATKKPLWAFEALCATHNPPTWIGNDALLLLGDATTPAVLCRLDGKSGAVRWKLPLNAYPSLPDQPPTGEIAGGFLPFGTVGEEVWVVDQQNRMHFVDAATGKRVRTLELGAPLIEAPRFAKDGTVILATQEEIRRVRLHTEPSDRPLTTVRILRIAALAALGREEELQSAFMEVSREATPSDWSAIAEALGNHPLACVASVRAMIGQGLTRSEALRDTYGLIARLPSAPVVAPPLVIEDKVYVLAADGSIHIIDPTSATTEDREEDGESITNWYLDDLNLMGVRYNGSPRLLRTLEAAPSLVADDPLYLTTPERPLDRAHTDPGWFERGGEQRVGASVQIGERLVRPMRGGGVRELVYGTAIDHPGLVPELEQWSYIDIGGKMYAIGETGVFELDANLRPHARFITVSGSDPRNPPLVRRIVVGPTSLALLVIEQGDSRLEIWKRDGSECIRTLDVVDVDHWPLLRVPEGVLHSGEQITFVPDDPSIPVKRFAMNVHDGRYRDGSEIRQTVFGPLRLVGSRIVVANRAGGIYVFDLDGLTR